MLAHVGDALLGSRLGSGLGLRGEREDSCVLPFIEPRQQHDLAIGKLERVMIGVKCAFVDLAKDRNGVAGIGTKHEGGLILDWRLEREFGTRKYADSHRAILRRGKSSRAGAEVVCDEFFADFGCACSHTVQTVVAHIKDLLSRKPPIVQC
jgi:Ribonuclease G/E